MVNHQLVDKNRNEIIVCIDVNEIVNYNNNNNIQHISQIQFIRLNKNEEWRTNKVLTLRDPGESISSCVTEH